MVRKQPAFDPNPLGPQKKSGTRVTNRKKSYDIADRICNLIKFLAVLVTIVLLFRSVERMYLASIKENLELLDVLKLLAVQLIPPAAVSGGIWCVIRRARITIHDLTPTSVGYFSIIFTTDDEDPKIDD